MKMNREGARKETRTRSPEVVDAYLTRQPRIRHKGWPVYICPVCGHGTHNKEDGLKRNPDSKDGNGWKCFDCGFAGDSTDIIQVVTGADYNTALKMAAEQIGIEIEPYRASAREDFDLHNLELPEVPAKGREAASFPKGKEDPTEPQKTPQGAGSEAQGADFLEYYKECSSRIKSQEDRRGMDYLTGRGISKETAARFMMGFDPGASDPMGRRRPGIITPVTFGHYVTRFIDQAEGQGRVRDTKINDKTEKGIFNHKAITRPGEGPVFITEGIFDALSIMEVRKDTEAVALNSVSGIDTFFAVLDTRPQEAAHTFILSLDNDDSGKNNLPKLEAGLRSRGITYFHADICREYKDPNKALTADRKEFSAAVERAIEATRADELDKFLERIQTTAYKPYETGLKFFDDLLGGGIVQKTVLLILAAPGSGKTTLCQQIAEEIASRGKPVIFLNLEMDKDQMLAKAISAAAARSGKSTMSATDIMQGYKWTPEQKEIVISTIKTYREKIFPFMKYNPAGLDGDLDNIHSYLEAQGQAAKAKGEPGPAVVLDYLHLVSTSKGMDVQELIKHTVTEIKQYAMNYDTFGIVISAANREANKSGRITLESGRDSSNIEYGGDAQISLNFWDFDQSKRSQLSPSNPEDVAALQREPYRRMILRVLKARFYEVGRYSRVYFHAATNRFFGEFDFTPFDDSDADEPRPRPFDTFTLDPDAGNYDLNALELPEGTGKTSGTKKTRKTRKGRDSI